MSDIVERAARVACPNGPDHDHIPDLDQTCHWALQLCQTLADAGLLVQTVPTREELADTVQSMTRQVLLDAPEASADVIASNVTRAVLELWEKVLEGSEDLDQPVTNQNINRASGAKFAEPTRAQVMQAVAPTLFNVLNYPRLGESIVPLAGKIADAVLELLEEK